MLMECFKGLYVVFNWCSVFMGICLFMGIYIFKFLYEVFFLILRKYKIEIFIIEIEKKVFIYL